MQKLWTNKFVDFGKMDADNIKLVGPPSGYHGHYRFYKTCLYLSKKGPEKILTLGQQFFVKYNVRASVCIGELQLLYEGKSGEPLCSVRLYFNPRNTPRGSGGLGQDEVLAENEKLVLRLVDLVTWIVDPSDVTWNIGLTAIGDEMKKGRRPKDDGVNIRVVSFAQYCRYRAVVRRLDGCWLKHPGLKSAAVQAIGGFIVSEPNTKILFCRETISHPDLVAHPHRKDHLAPILKGRPRKKLSVNRTPSPETEEELPQQPASPSKADSKQAAARKAEDACKRHQPARDVTQLDENTFLADLYQFMKARKTPIEKLPSLGFKTVDLYEFFKSAQEFGGYDAITQGRLWKALYDKLGGHPTNTSAATCTRRHYERLLLPYENHLYSGENTAPGAKDRRKKKPNSKDIADTPAAKKIKLRLKLEGKEWVGVNSPTPDNDDVKSTRKTVKRELELRELEAQRIKEEIEEGKEEKISVKKEHGDDNVIKTQLTNGGAQVVPPESHKKSAVDVAAAEPNVSLHRPSVIKVISSPRARETLPKEPWLVGLSGGPPGALPPPAHTQQRPFGAQMTSHPLPAHTHARKPAVCTELPQDLSLKRTAAPPGSAGDDQPLDLAKRRRSDDDGDVVDLSQPKDHGMRLPIFKPANAARAAHDQIDKQQQQHPIYKLGQVARPSYSVGAKAPASPWSYSTAHPAPLSPPSSSMTSSKPSARGVTTPLKPTPISAHQSHHSKAPPGRLDPTHHSPYSSRLTLNPGCQRSASPSVGATRMMKSLGPSSTPTRSNQPPSVISSHNPAADRGKPFSHLSPPGPRDHVTSHRGPSGRYDHPAARTPPSSATTSASSPQQPFASRTPQGSSSRSAPSSSSGSRSMQSPASHLPTHLDARYRSPTELLPGNALSAQQALSSYQGALTTLPFSLASVPLASLPISPLGPLSLPVVTSPSAVTSPPLYRAPGAYDLLHSLTRPLNSMSTPKGK